jgi:pimeloyl-ACP methyl ester carboxylesterase
MTNPSALLASRAKERGVAKNVDLGEKRTAYWFYQSENSSDASQTVVMIHGYRGNHHGLEAIVGALSSANVIVPDLPGFGDSEPFDQNHSIERYARWVGEFLTALRDSGEINPAKITLLGHSFGTIVVAAAVAEQLVQPARVVLINPVSAPALSGPRALMTKLTAGYYWAGGALPNALGNALLGSPLIVRGMSILLAKTNDKKLRRWIHREHDLNFSNFASRRVAHEGFLASISANVGQFASRIAQPTLMIIGERDDITSVADQHLAQAKFANATLEQIDGVGHLIHYEAPVLAARLIENFIEAAK